MASGLFGWDLLYTSVINDIKNNADVLVCFTHYVLISRGFSCIGIGDDKLLEGNEEKCENLPAGWNEGYTLRYVYEGRLYHLKATPVDDSIQVNLIRVDERKISLVTLNLRMVLKRQGTVAEMIPNFADIKSNIEKQLVEPVITSDKSKTQETQTTSTTTETRQPRSPVTPDDYLPDPLMVGRPRNPMLDRRPVGVGSADLDPFFGGSRPFGPGLGGMGVGGGMLYPSPGGDPLGIGGPQMPRRGVPPGARFDHFFPPDPDAPGRAAGPRRNPGSDFPPPEFGNMFM